MVFSFKFFFFFFLGNLPLLWGALKCCILKAKSSHFFLFTPIKNDLHIISSFFSLKEFLHYFLKKNPLYSLTFSFSFWFWGLHGLYNKQPFMKKLSTRAVALCWFKNPTYNRVSFFSLPTHYIRLLGKHEKHGKNVARLALYFL